MNSLTVCVGYSDLLAITLPRNARHFHCTLVVTSPGDSRTIELVESLQRTMSPQHVQYFKTDAFTRHGATFNKGLAIEEAFDVLGRSGWMCVWDADTLLPTFPRFLKVLTRGILYSAARRILHDPKEWHPTLDWNSVPIVADTRPTTFPGYYHIFHAEDEALKTPSFPWYDVTFKHAGGGDGFFQSRWPKDKKVRLPDPVLHLGPRDTNWFGLSEEALMENDRYRRAKGWVRGVPPDYSYQERVNVPGYEARNWVYAPGE